MKVILKYFVQAKSIRDVKESLSFQFDFVISLFFK